MIARRWMPYGVAVAAAIVLFIVPLFVRRGAIEDLTSLLLLVTLAVAWNLVGGFGGQFSLGHAVFVGVGGYAMAVLLQEWQLPLWIVLPIASTISAVVGVVLGYPMLRLRGPYFAIGTLGISLAVLGWMLNWQFTNASQAYPIPAGIIDRTGLFWLVVLAAFVAFVSVQATMQSPLGLRLLALRDDEGGAAALGVRRVRTLLPVWAISGLFTGLMGALAALQAGTLTPNSAFALQFTLDAIIICVIGGLGTIAGPVIGAVLVFVLRQLSTGLGAWALLVEALVVILVVRLVPGGLVGVIERAWGAVRTRAGRGRVSAVK